MQREIGDRDVDARFFRSRRDHPQLPQLLGGLESVAALHFDGRRAERDRARETSSDQREQVVVARLARRPHRRMDAAATLEHREVIRTTPPRHELVPPLARITEMRVRVDEPGHHDAPFGIDLDRFRRALEVMPRVATTGRDNDAVARCEPTAVDRADVACRRADARLLILERRQCEKTRASYDEIRFHLRD